MGQESVGGGMGAKAIERKDRRNPDSTQQIQEKGRGGREQEEGQAGGGREGMGRVQSR